MIHGPYNVKTIMTVPVTAEVLIYFKFKFYLVPNLRPIPPAVELKINSKTNIFATEIFKFNCNSNILKLPKYLILIYIMQE